MKKIIALVLISTVFTSRIAAAAAAEQKDCTLKQYASVDFLPMSKDLLLIPITVNGKNAAVVLNLGLGLSMVAKDAPNSFGLKVKNWPNNFRPLNIGSERVKRIATADSIAIGQLSFGANEFVVDERREIGGPIDSTPVIGMIGMSFFANVDFELDFVNRRLNLYSQEHCVGQVVYWANNYAAVPIREGDIGDRYLLMELEGKKMQTALSTVAATTILNTDASKTLFGFDEKSDGVVSESNAAGDTVSHYQAMALTTDGLEIMNAKIKLSAPSLKYCRFNEAADKESKAAGYSSCSGIYPLSLGMNVLQKMHLYFAMREKVMYFTAAEANKSNP
ncbi:MAG: hypothetical protein QM808_13655 [Steroidobacteraceae bacterium]